MIELVVVACLLSDPGHCERFPVPFVEPMSQVECVSKGQFRLAQWSTQHPEWRIRRWDCAPPEA